MICLFKQKTAYEMRISDLSSDVCSSDLEGVNVKTFWASFFCEGDVNVEASRVVTSASRQSSLEGQQFWRCWCVGMSRVRELLTSKGAERASRVEAKRLHGSTIVDPAWRSLGGQR